MSELRFHRAARIELAEAATYYESQRPGYGRKFEAEFDAVVERVLQFPESGGLLPGYPPELEVRAFHFKTFRHALIVATVARWQRRGASFQSKLHSCQFETDRRPQSGSQPP